MLLVDELVRGVLGGGAPSRVLVLEVSQDSVRVAVEDPHITPHQFSTAHGAAILDDLADEWGYGVGSLGTSVWFTLGRPGH